jgi:hypothetical protein
MGLLLLLLLSSWYLIIVDKQTVASAIWEPNVHYFVHKRAQMVLALSQMNPAHSFPSF